MPQHPLKLLVVFLLGCGIYFSVPYFFSKSASSPHCPGSYPFSKIDGYHTDMYQLTKVGTRGSHADLPWIFKYENEKLNKQKHRGWYTGNTIEDYTAHVYTSPVSDMYYIVIIEDQKGCYFDLAPVNKIYWVTYIGM